MKMLKKYINMLFLKEILLFSIMILSEKFGKALPKKILIFLKVFYLGLCFVYLKLVIKNTIFIYYNL